MSDPSCVLQVCVSCKRARAADGEDRPQPSVSDAPEGRQLHDALQDAIGADPALASGVTLQAVECMSNCDHSCTVALRANDKFNFVLGALDASPERVEDIVTFTSRYLEADKGLPAWRERPVHIRKNTIARLHPAPLPRTSQD